MAEQPNHENIAEQTASSQDQGNKVTVNIDHIRKQRIHICMPCYGGMLTESCFMSFIKWGNTCRQLGIDWTLETMSNESLISRGRNTLTAKFLNNPDSTHLMFIDADIGWEPWHLLALIDADKDIIGGLYPMKTLPVKWVVNAFDGSKTDNDGKLLEVSKTGTGFMLIKREVFEKLKEHPNVEPYNNDIGLDSSLDEHLRSYFDSTVRDNRFYSEDWDFCEKYRDLGGEVWVDKRIMLKHTGTFTFDQAVQGPLYEELKRLEAAGKGPTEK